MNLFSKKEIKLKQAPEPNIADIKVKTEESAIIIEYPTKRNLDKQGQPNSEIAEIRFTDVVDYRYGEPNDEGFFIYFKNTFDYPALGFELDRLYEVVGLQNDFGKKNIVLLKDEAYKHYIFFVKEGTFECIAKGYELL